MLLPLTILTIAHLSASQGTQPMSQPHGLEHLLSQISRWGKQQLDLQKEESRAEYRVIIAWILCFIAASVSSAGGVGGGSLYLPILNLVAGLDLKSSTSHSAFMVTAGSLSNVLYNIFFTNPGLGGKSLINYEICLLSEPCMLLGVSIGVVCNLMFPEWLITALFAAFLASSTYKTCSAGFKCWKLETEEVRRGEAFRLERGGNEVDENGMEESLLGGGEVGGLRVPWKDLVVLLMIWLCFFVLHVLLGNEDGKSGREYVCKDGVNVYDTCVPGAELKAIWEGISYVRHILGADRVYLEEDSTIVIDLIGSKVGVKAQHPLLHDIHGLMGVINTKPCGVAYWLITLSQVPFAIGFTACILYDKKKKSLQPQSHQEIDGKDITVETKIEALPLFLFPSAALFTGVLGGLFGIGGGLLINPVLLQIGIPPQITAATTTFIVLFSASMSMVQYVILGMMGIRQASIYAAVSFVASPIGLAIIQRAIEKSGRVSLIVFMVSMVMALSTVSITCFGALDVWRQYTTGSYMGFKPPC